MMNTPRFTSLHNHTLFCDGKDDIETMCRAAFDKGLYAVGFSSHAPLFKQTGIMTDWHLLPIRMDEYVSEVRAAARRWDGKLKVYLGIELDYITGVRSVKDKDIAAQKFDYIIGSVHYVMPPFGEAFTVDGPEKEMERGMEEMGGDGSAMMKVYWNSVAEMIALGGIDIIGHVDIVRKNNHDKRFFDDESDEYLSRAAEIARAAATAGIAVEVNTGGINRGKTTETYPSLPILRLFRENNVPALITADAHNAKDIAGNYDVACQTLKAAGYTEHHIFEGRKDGKICWSTEAL